MMRRAVALPMVLLLLLVGSMAISAALQRQNTQSLTVRRMISNYELHHESFGVRAVVKQWLERAGRNEEITLSALALEDGPTHRFQMPGDTRIAVKLRDFQWAPVRDATGKISASNVSLYNDIAKRVEARSRGSVRSTGPALLSVASMPEFVVESLVEDPERGARIAEQLDRERSRGRVDRGGFTQVLRRAGLEDQQIARLTSMVTFDPVLWEVQIVTSVGSGESRRERRDRMIVELVNDQPQILSWQEMTPADGIRSEERDPERRGTR